MPNNTRIPLCPFYKDEKNKSISCEDVYRSFPSVKKKYAWMDMYCDEWNWMRCPYAVDLNEAYARLEKGDKKALEKHEIEALRKELKSISTKLGRAEKRIERQQKKIDQLRAVNNSFTIVNNKLEQQKKEFYGRWRTAQAELNKGNEQVLEELGMLGIIYEQRMCCLIDKFAPEKILREDDVKEWAGDRDFALVADADAEHGRFWKVVFKRDENEDIPDEKPEE